MSSDRSPPPVSPALPAGVDEPEIPRGEAIGRHVVIGVVGRGATGTVYKAFDTHLSRQLAIKILHREHAWGEGGDPIELRMRREAQAMARLNHPNVVTVHDVGVYDHRIFIAMEFVDGGTLRSWLAGDHRWRERLKVVVSAGRGLAAAHAAGLVHRDFKPDNVLVGKDGRVLVTDFGLARIADEAESGAPKPDEAPATREATADAATLTATPIRKSGPTLPAPAPIRARAPSAPPLAPPEPLTNGPSLTTPLTLTGSILGTLGYMAPEQAFGEGTNAASDQFSFCATLHLALYGRRPFPGTDVESYLTAIERPLAPPPADTEVPAWIHRALARGLSRDPGERFPSMDALLAALAADPKRVLRRRRTIAGAAFALGVVVAATTAFALRRPTQDCAADPADLAGVWDEAARADVAAAFARSGAVGSADVAARVTAVLDETAAKWTAMKAESCDATLVKQRQSADAYALRAECLDRRRSELRALTSSLRVADREVVERAVAASYGLTNVAVCADVAMLRKSGGLPDAPDAREKVQDAQRALAQALSLQLVGKLAESTRAAESALDLARASKHESTVAEALRVLGGLKVEQNEHAQAEKLLSEATWTASKAGADALVVSAASITAFVVAKLGRPGEAKVWLGVAEASLGRVGASPALELEFEEHRAWVVADGDGRAEETIPLEERIAQTYQQLYGVHPRTLRALYNLGDALTTAGDHARACDVYARAVAMGEAIGGPIYSWTGYALAGRGDCLVAQGDYANGDKALGRAVAIFEATSDEYSEVEALEVVIRSALAQGDMERGVASAEKAKALLAQVEGTASLVAIVNVPMAEAFMRAPAARSTSPAESPEALCAEAEHEQEALSEVDPAKTLRADALRCLGEALILAGKPRDALAYLERSLAIPHRTYPGDLARARFAMARALAASGGDPTRATSLASEARDELAAAPGLQYELGVVQRWIAARP